MPITVTSPPPSLLLDASCLLNLYATALLREFAGTLPYQFAVADYVLEQEALYTWLTDPAGTREKREPVDLTPLVREGLIQVMRLENLEEELTFVDLAASIEDGEAVTAALAFHRGCSVAIDDRKERRVLEERVPTVQLVSTLDLLKLWSQDASVSDVELREAMMSMRSGASYVPGYRDPLYAWWREVMHGGAS